MIDVERFVNLLLYGHYSRDYNRAWETFRNLDGDFRDDVINYLHYAIQYPERLWEVAGIVTNPNLPKVEELRDCIENLKVIHEKISQILNRDKANVKEDERELIARLLQNHIDILNEDIILAALRSGIDLPEEYCEVLEDHDLLYASMSGGKAVGKMLYNRALLPPEQATWEAKWGYIDECVRRGDKSSFIKIAALLSEDERNKLRKKVLFIKTYTSDFEYELEDLTKYL